MTKEEILNKHGTSSIYNDGHVYDGGTPEIFEAMDEWAKQQAIGFAKWLSNHTQDFQPAKGGKWIGNNLEVMSCSDLYTEYLLQQQIK